MNDQQGDAEREKKRNVRDREMKMLVGLMEACHSLGWEQGREGGGAMK